MIALLFLCLALVPLLIVVQVDDAVFQKHVAIFFEALRLSDISEAKACQWMTIDPAQFRRQTRDRIGQISLTRMMGLPLIFWQFYALLLAEYFGIPYLVVRAVRVLIVTKARRQLRMSAGPRSAERRLA